MFIAAEQRDERVKVILESNVISCVKTCLTSMPRSRQLVLRLVAELVKTGTPVSRLCFSILMNVTF